MLPPRHDEASGICEAACEHEKMLHTGSEAKTTSSTRRALHSLASCQKRCLNFCASALCKLHVPTYQKILGEMAIIWYNFSLAEARAIVAHHHDHPTNWPNDVPASLALKIACAASSGFVSVSVDLRCFCLPKSASTRTCQIRDQSHGNIGLHFKICSKASRAASKAAVQQMPCRHAMI